MCTYILYTVGSLVPYFQTNPHGKNQTAMNFRVLQPTWLWFKKLVCLYSMLNIQMAGGCLSPTNMHLSSKGQEADARWCDCWAKYDQRVHIGSTSLVSKWNHLGCGPRSKPPPGWFEAMRGNTTNCPQQPPPFASQWLTEEYELLKTQGQWSWWRRFLPWWEPSEISGRKLQEILAFKLQIQPNTLLRFVYIEMQGLRASWTPSIPAHINNSEVFKPQLHWAITRSENGPWFLRKKRKDFGAMVDDVVASGELQSSWVYEQRC